MEYGGRRKFDTNVLFIDRDGAKDRAGWIYIIQFSIPLLVDVMSAGIYCAYIDVVGLRG
jgi:hypothetical protein